METRKGGEVKVWRRGMMERGEKERWRRVEVGEVQRHSWSRGDRFGDMERRDGALERRRKIQEPPYSRV